VGKVILDCLRAEGVGHVFGIVGSSFLELADAFHGADDITFVGARHEQAAAHMAEAYARAKLGLGVCVATSGPGVTNLATGVAMAKQAFSPVIVIGGASSTEHEFRDTKQEVDQLNFFRPIAKDVLRITRADRAAELMRHAARVALTGQMGPVYVDVPKDVFAQETPYEIRDPASYRPAGGAAPAPACVSQAVSLMRDAERPLIVAGGEFKWTGGVPDLMEFAGALGAPVVTSSGHRDLIANDHALFFGQLGQRGSTVAADLARRADVIFALGTRLAFTTTNYSGKYINAQAKIIQCGIEAKEIGRLFPLALGFVGDAGNTARACAAEVRAQQTPVDFAPWRQWAEDQRRAWAAARDAPLKDAASPIGSGRLFAEIRRAAPKDVRVTIDAGYWGGKAHDAFDHDHCPSLFTPLEYRSVGVSFPMALGVKFAAPDAPVLCVHGDGGFAMNLQELETAARFGLNPVVLVLNNFSWGAEKAHQRKNFGERFVGSDIGNPRFDKVAEDFGANGARVENADQIGDALAQAWRSDRATVIDVIVNPDEF